MEFKNPEQELHHFHQRLTSAGSFVLFAFALLFARFVWLQVIQHEYYQTRAEDNRISLVPILPNRGLIVDSKGTVLAHNYSAYTLEITPQKAGDLDKTIDGLEQIIDIQAKDRKRFRKLLEESRNFESLPIRTRLSDEEVAKFIAHRYRFPGVEIKARLFRQYPFAESASHLLGYIGRITDRDIDAIENKNFEDNYRGTEHFGKSGLEQKYEFELHGQTGFEQVEIDSSGRAVRVLSRIPPVAGNNLTLTIDAELQEVAELAFGERRGALVAIALVLGSVFVPAAFVTGIAGQFYRQFALTIAAATVLSLLVSLTLSPAVAALILRPHQDHAGQKGLAKAVGVFGESFNRRFDQISSGYGKLTKRLLGASALVLVVYAVLLVVTGWRLSATPGGFIPASTLSKLSRSISTSFRSFTLGSGSSGLPERSASTPTTKGISSVRSALAFQPARAFTAGSATRSPSQLRRSDSRTSRMDTGSFEIGPTPAVSSAGSE